MPLIISLLSFPVGLKISEVIAQESQALPQEITVEENLHSGKILILSNGSSWMVAPSSLNVSQTWITPSGLKIEPSGNAYYPYSIINLQTKASVLVRPLAREPTKGLNILH
ncbi:MAG: hypothetical protein KDK60_00150 [Chlamydiia bacterium]|nr:hypothetical protein [Chlamydiia bacterium]